MKRILCIALALTAFVVTSPAAAKFDVGPSLDLDMNGSLDVQAFSDFRDPGPVFFSYGIDDWVARLNTDSLGMTSLTYDWQISSAHRHRGVLPLPGTGLWAAKNSWYGYRFPIHVDFELDLSGTGAAGPFGPYTRTASGHEPFPSLANIQGFLSSSAQTGGYYAYADYIAGPETKILEVWSVVTALPNGGYHYEYWAR